MTNSDTLANKPNASHSIFHMSRSQSEVSVLAPTFEHHHDGFGVQCSRPRISWRFSCSSVVIRDWQQTAYDVEICHDNSESGQVFSIEGNNSILVPWPCPESLQSRARCSVRVRCHGRYSLSDQAVEKSVTEWSSWSRLEIALLENSDWTGRMISVSGSWPLSPDGSARPLSFHKSFNLPSNQGNVTRARLYVTSHGVYHARVNGKEIGNYCLSPGYQSYHKRIHYQIYDAAHLLSSSEVNKIEIDVAAGWFASSWAWFEKRFVYGRKLGVLIQLEIWFADSPSPFTVSTDESWDASTSAIVSSEIYDGEICDLRLNNSSTNTNSATRFSVEESPIAVSRLVSPEAAPVRLVGEITPQDISKSRSGNAVIVDFGQNFAGRICVKKIQKPSGTSITFRYAEVIQDGEIVQRPLRTAKARDILICDASEILDWHPNHTFHGFRYVEITGWDLEDQDCPFTQSSIVAQILHTDMSRTGWFSCSNEDVNRLHENSLWGMKSNFLSVPTECPSRDERLGWTGDLNIFAPTANFLHSTAGMLRNWLDDLYLDQMEESRFWRQGVVPLFIPNSLLKMEDGGEGWDPMPNGVWCDAAIMVPWELYRTFGDVEILTRQYDSMVQYLEHGVSRDEDGLWDPDQWQFGDWLDPRAPQNDSGRGTTDGTFVADCFLIVSTQIIVEVAKLLDKPADSSRYQDTARSLLQAWRGKYLTNAGFVTPDTATALSLAIAFDLIPDSDNGWQRRQAASRLARNVRFNDFKITTGFVGTAYLLHALRKSCGVELAYGMLFQKDFPSFLYPVTMGATTTWERWDSMLPDGSVNPGSMTSFNHHALGSVAHWLHTDVGGLEAMEPGWKVFRVNPRPNKELTWAETVFESQYGRIELKWTLRDDELRLTLCVPPNSSAIVTLPGDSETDDQKAVNNPERRVGSGIYVFECQFVQTNWPPQAMLPPWGRQEF